MLTAFYDLEHGPVSYDFVTWLVRAKKEAGTRKLHVVIIPKENGIGGFSRDWGGHDEAAARWRLWHIVVASCPLAGATVTVAANREQAERLRQGEHWWPSEKAHFMAPLVDAARSGEEIPKLKATDAASRYVKKWLGNRFIVTLTMRRQESDPARNSSPDWEPFGDWIAAKKYKVVRLFDTNDALNCGRGYAELDPDLRLALYERASMNVSANAGTQELLKFSHAPFILMGQGLGGWASHFERYFHMKVGDQLPWARKDQRLVYERDSLEVLKRSFADWESCHRVG